MLPDSVVMARLPRDREEGELTGRLSETPTDVCTGVYTTLGHSIITNPCPSFPNPGQSFPRKQESQSVGYQRCS